MDVGELRIEPVLDGVARIPASAAYAGTPEEDWAGHRQFLDAEGNLELAIGGFLIRTGDRVVLVDAGLGNHTAGAFSGGAMLDNLAALGVQPSDVTDVIFTHLHFDHVGWATTKGTVVFDRATFRCDERDWDHFIGPDRDAGATKKLLPIADRLEPFSGSGPVPGLAGIDVMAAAGHTPGSTIVVVSSGTDRAMLLGDVVHCPVELLDDEWEGMADVDPELAKRTRNLLARELEGQDVPVAAAHFPGMQFGRLLAGSGRRSWVVG
jgi:glyoxylase-like metal-dependent hydrolase (beta-lactamase superfamily II)